MIFKLGSSPSLHRSLLGGEFPRYLHWSAFKLPDTSPPKNRRRPKPRMLLLDLEKRRPAQQARGGSPYSIPSRPWALATGVERKPSTDLGRSISSFGTNNPGSPPSPPPILRGSCRCSYTVCRNTSVAASIPMGWLFRLSTLSAAPDSARVASRHLI